MVKIKSLLFFILTFFRKNVGDIELKMRKGHIEGVCRGKCNTKLTSNYKQILHNMDQMSNRCVNLADIKKIQLKKFFWKKNLSEVKI